MGTYTLELARRPQGDPEVLVVERELEPRGEIVLEEVAAPDLHHLVAGEAA